MTEVLKNPKLCTGCGACSNICHTQAISMQSNAEGFIHPVIAAEKCVNCGKCERICPVLHPQYKNTAAPKTYAMMADDDIRAVSSSGGFFSVVANEIFYQGGVVYGAAWTDDWHVEHISVDNERDLARLRGSKYLQSNTQKTYQEAEKQLRSGRAVLYSGCPCQIAGLYAYLGEKDYPKLWTVEIICHGVPSPEAFQKYLADNFGKKKINRIDFRDKTISGWSTTTNIWFDDGDTYRAQPTTDVWYKGFLPCMTMRNACSTCPFSKLPRQADITMGDFWGVERYKSDWDDKKGTSIILVNNDHGSELFDAVRSHFQRCEEVPLEYGTHINKTIEKPFRQHPGRKHFYSSLSLKPFNKLVNDSLTHRYDIGVVGLWYGINYGSVLTYYALYVLLKDLGYDPVMLPKPNDLWTERFNEPDSLGQKFIWSHCNVLLPYSTQAAYRRANDLCDDFILGSDVVWSYDVCGRHTDQFFFLDWVESRHKKIAYASSFGNALTGDPSYVTKAKYYLSKFDAISAREQSGAEFLKQECGIKNAENVLDPVFVCNPKVFDDAIREARIEERAPFVFAYVLRYDQAKETLKIIDKACDCFNAVPKICGNPNDMPNSRKYYGNLVMNELSVQEWLYYIKNCEMYVGDSYHALCFSLLFHKPFIIIYGKANYGYAAARFQSLLKLVGLEDRFVENASDFEECVKILEKQDIDWNEVDRRLEGLREFSFTWLKNVLERSSREPSAEDYIFDAQSRYVDEMSIRIHEISQELQQFARKATPGSMAMQTDDSNLSASLHAVSQSISRLEHMMDEQSRESNFLLHQMNLLTSSKSFKIGRAITWVPRKVYRGYRCIQENGILYTIKLFCKKVRSRL